MKLLLKRVNGIANSSVVARKSLLEKINFLSEDKRKYSWEDYDCWIRYSKVTDNFLFIPDILGFCWVGGGNISNLNQTYINYKNFHKIYRKQIFDLTKKKDWIGIKKFLLVWYFKKKVYIGHICFKKITPNDLNSFLRLILIKIIFFSKIIKKFTKI